MSLAGWVVLVGESVVAQQLERQAEGAIRLRYPPGEMSIRDERISEFPCVVNKLENPGPAEFSNREFVFACLLGSQFKSFIFNVHPTEHASSRAAPRPGLK
jgi:hypothetical protein